MWKHRCTRNSIEQFQAVAWIILLLLLTEMLILERKNPLFRNIHLFSNKK